MEKTRYFLPLIIYALLSLLFQGAALFFGYKRYVFGAEMLLSFLLLALGMVTLGSIAFMGAVAIELALGISSLFFLYEIGQISDMAEFIFEARPVYLTSLAVLFLLILFSVWLVVRLGNGLLRIRQISVFLFVGVVFFQCQWMLSSENDVFFTPSFGDQTQLLFGSGIYLDMEVMAANRNQIMGRGPDADADFVPIHHSSAANLVWKEQSPSSRVLFIIGEAWGLPRESSALEKQITSLRSNPHVQSLVVDKIQAIGATAAGELRELCGVIPTRLNFRKLTSKAVGDCLPARLHRQGYATVGIHGADGGMYRRTLWWPEIGLEERLFKETIPSSEPLCFSFPGHCDRHLLNIVKEKLSSEKTFVYWLTLNSHFPYDQRDIVNFREGLCEAWKAPGYSEQLCDYQNLHAQFFEGLASLVDDPSMKGVEVVVVGDHPPLFNDTSSRERFFRDQVPVMHFFVK